MRGTPYVMRLETGLRKPRATGLGVDFAGTVEAVGRHVTQFAPGDEVFGGRAGAFAEYVSVAEDRALVLKPDTLTFDQAAAVPIAGVTALQALRDKGRVGPGFESPDQRRVRRCGYLCRAVTAVIDRRYRLHEVPAAIRYLEQGRARGKVVIAME